MLGNSYSGAGLVSHSNHCSTLWVLHPYSIEFIHYSSPPHYKWITALLAFIPISDNASYTGTPTDIITATNLSGSHTTWMFNVLPCFEGPHINLTGGRFTTITGLSASMLYFVNRTTGWWSAPSFTIDGCACKETSGDAIYTSLLLHDSGALLYCDSISHYHIILAGCYHITNWYWKNSSRHLCTIWGTLASDSKNVFSPLKSDTTVNYDTHKYFLNFPMAHLTASTSPKNPCVDFYSGDTVDTDMK